MDTKNIMCCVVALLLGMLLANMLQNVCGCKVFEGQSLTVGRNLQGEGHSKMKVHAGNVQAQNLGLHDTSTLELSGGDANFTRDATADGDSKIIMTSGKK